MTTQRTPPLPPDSQPYHESVHTRSAVNTDHSGERVCDVESSTLAMYWHGGELRLSHRLTNVTRQSISARRPPRGVR